MKQLSILPFVFVFLFFLAGCIRAAPTTGDLDHDECELVDMEIHKRDYVSDSDIYARNLKAGVDVVLNSFKANPKIFKKPIIWFSGEFKSAKGVVYHSQRAARQLVIKHKGATVGDLVREAGVDFRKEKWTKDDWRVVCRDAAKRTEGTTHVAIGTVIRDDSTWKQVELPELMKNNLVSEILEHKIKNEKGELELVGDLKKHTK